MSAARIKSTVSEANPKRNAGSERGDAVLKPLIRVWSLEENIETKPFEVYKGMISGMAVSANGGLLATSGTNLTLWNVPGRTKAADFDDKSSEFHFTHCVAFSPDGNTLAAGSGDHFEFGRPWQNCGVKLWDVGTKNLIAHLVHDTPVYSVAFSADGRKLVAGGESELVVWTLNSSAAA